MISIYESLISYILVKGNLNSQAQKLHGIWHS